ncbi:MAG: cytochrome c oxidase assembly protein, partial [Alphaproteobacteria bacterium]|nr:cytochrome c oxidase assembly protein [Alphaproteobacteria bacterium]
MRALMLSGWSFQPYVVASLAIADLWFLAGLVRMRRRLRPGRGISAARTAAFAGGLAALALALLSPLDMLGEQLFCAHMVQHLLLILLAAPLLAWSRPVVVFVWALPRAMRRTVARGWGGFGGRGAVNALMHQFVVWFLFAASFVFWHCPGPYTLALGSEGVHAMEHLSFLVTALMFWSIVLDPTGHRRLGYGGTMIFI